MDVPWATLQLTLIQTSRDESDNHATNDEFVSIFVTNLGVISDEYCLWAENYSMA